MKAWVIIEYLDGSYINRRVCATADAATRWIADRCGCDKRHDIWGAEIPWSIRGPLAVNATPEEVKAWRVRWRTWIDQFCHNDYDVDEWEVSE